jgi:hypothetical protein
MEGATPYGGFNATSRLNASSWPIAGGNIGFLAVHPNATWEFNAALSKKLDPMDATEPGPASKWSWTAPQAPDIGK